jgi:hypothetical protein
MNDITEPVTTVIADVADSFRGNFDGQGHKITLAIDRPMSNRAGLFGSIADAILSNIVVDGYVNGHNNVGGIVGSTNQYAAGNFSNTSIINCTNLANINGNSCIGGIIG